jgi:hypothetical protein
MFVYLKTSCLRKQAAITLRDTSRRYCKSLGR